jgi:hypothetical protein
MRAGLKINHGQIESTANAADDLQRIIGAVSQVAKATGSEEDTRDAILQLRVVRQEKYEWSLHAATVPEPARGRSAAIAI